jgi:phosphonate degradation associated HDIG domain protein
MPALDNILRLFHQGGHSEYGGEAVTQLEHALQCAMMAEQQGADAELITAALLHDIGHLVHDLPADAPERGIDDRHEDLGHRYLTAMFTESVTEPVRLHVDAKRYLCTVEPGYLERLSAPSVTSLRLQGGPMTSAEVAAFEASPHGKAASRLRRWDDEAKIPDLKTPEIEHFADAMRIALDAKSRQMTD